MRSKDKFEIIIFACHHVLKSMCVCYSVIGSGILTLVSVLGVCSSEYVAM